MRRQQHAASGDQSPHPPAKNAGRMGHPELWYSGEGQRRRTGVFDPHGQKQGQSVDRNSLTREVEVDVLTRADGDSVYGGGAETPVLQRGNYFLVDVLLE